MTNFIDLESKYQINVYPKRDLVLISGKNARVWDEQGKEYIDCVAGHGVANLGHGNEKIIAAIQEQAQKIITCSNLFYNDTRALLLEKLVKIAPKNLNKAFLCNSGTESIEAAIKFTRYSTRKTEFICAMRGFHGRTLGSLSATFNPKYRDDFKPLLPGFNFVPFNNFEKLKEKINKNTAGILLEIVQGEGGVNIGKEEYFLKVRELCDKKGIFLIVDEVQSGFCRTGKIFACNYFNLEPDLLCLAKSMAGGLPMGAVLCSDKIELEVGKHGSTFGGNPLSCAAAIAAIDYMLQHKLEQQAKEKGEYFISQFKRHNLGKVREIRNLGLMIGIELKEE
ncbi:MAG: aspartate aminotransferase family protein, partial [bacterium]